MRAGERIRLRLINMANARSFAPEFAGHAPWVVARDGHPLAAPEVLDGPVTMEELCQLTHVSRRTLQYSFTTILGISPLQFLRLTRLNRVRRALRAASPEQSVTEIATYWGFWHLGQFAHDYKQQFGESPSQTLSAKTC